MAAERQQSALECGSSVLGLLSVGAEGPPCWDGLTGFSRSSTPSHRSGRVGSSPSITHLPLASPTAVGPDSKSSHLPQRSSAVRAQRLLDRAALVYGMVSIGGPGRPAGDWRPWRVWARRRGVQQREIGVPTYGDYETWEYIRSLAQLGAQERDRCEISHRSRAPPASPHDTDS
jgi:hypothetical protein